MHWYVFVSGIISGLLFVSGLFTLSLSLRRIERDINISYAILAFCLAGVLLHGLYITGVPDVATKLFHNRLANTLYGVAGVAFLSLVSGLTGFRSRWPRVLITVGLVLFVVLVWMLPYGITYSEIHGTAPMRTPWGVMRSRIDGEAGIWNLYSLVLLFSLLLYAVVAVLRQARRGACPNAGLLLSIIAIGISGIIIDTMLIEFHLGEIGIVDDLGYLALVFLVMHRNFRNLIHSADVIRESRARYARMSEASFEGIGFTRDGIIVDVNQQLADMLGYEGRELIGRPVMDLIAPHHLDVVARHSRATEASYEHDAVRKDGTVLPVEVRVKEVHQTDHTLRVAAVRDISERRRAEQMNVLLAQALKSARDCISVTDHDGRIMFVNDAFLQYYGYTDEEILGQSILLLRGDGSPAGLPSDLDDSWHGVVMNRRKDGTKFPVELWTSVARGRDGSVLAYVGVARDVSDRREAERALIAAKEHAERSDRLKDAFIANISHEIRTPLNIILGYTSLIAEILEGRVSDEEMGYFESVQRGSTRLMRTVDLILSLSRVQVGDIEIDPVRFDLTEAARAITNDYRAVARKKDLELRYEGDGATPITADEYCVAQSLHNLLDNAIKYTDAGAITVRVERRADGDVQLSVSDTGIGISSEYLPTIFTPYTQEDSGLTRGYEGIGLGLSLVKQYTELNRGHIEIESTKGVGTTVRVVFPAGEQVATPGKTDEPLRDTAHVRVLLVEDDPLSIEFMRTIFAKDFLLREAASAEAAMELLAREEFELVLMDISLSGAMNGLELTRMMKSSPAFRHIPVIAVTAHGFTHDRRRCLEAGCDAYLIKPVGREELLAVMRPLLRVNTTEDSRDS
ncbi:MAG: PAS domain S-box protein [Bacteroidota bacterium]|jgi:PAS domain S-box-containing protein|nr:PAS domain S-box protein [Bacteroidota bacterium]